MRYPFTQLQKLAWLPLITALLLINGCGQPEGHVDATSQPEPVKVGVILPLTGLAAVYGEHARAGQVKAMEELRAEKGEKLPITLLVEDGKGDPKASIAAYYKLRDQGVRVFTTTLSAVSMALKPLAEQDSVLFFGNAAHPGITDPSSPLTFRHSNTALQEAELLAGRLDALRSRRVALLYIADDYGLASSEALKQKLAGLSIPIVLEDVFDKAQTDFSVLGQKTKRAAPDAVVVVGFGNAMGLLLKHLHDISLRPPTLASIGYVLTGADQQAGEAKKNVEFVTFDFPIDNATSTSSGVRSFEILEYGTVMLIAEAVGRAGGEPKALAQALQSKQRFSTAFETMTITPTGDITPTLRLEQAK